MLGESAQVRWRRAGLAIALAAAYVASVLLGVFVSRAGGPGATLWTANGFLAAAFVLLGRRWQLGIATFCILAQAAIELAAGDGLPRAILFALVNLIDAALAGWLAISFCGVRVRRLSLRELALLELAAIAPAALIGGAVGALAATVLTGQPFMRSWMAWTIPGGLGMAIVLPGVLLTARAGQYREFQRSVWESAGILGGHGLLVATVFLQGDLPMQFVIFPALTVVAVRLGPPGAAAGGLLTAIIALPVTLSGHGPATLLPALDVPGRVRFIEVVIAAALFSTLVTAVAVAERTRLFQLMLGRDRAARAALARARQAEIAAAARGKAVERQRIADPV
jgi:integral membrane sensor domain MASE1